jgi:hypothetical protein
MQQREGLAHLLYQVLESVSHSQATFLIVPDSRRTPLEEMFLQISVWLETPLKGQKLRK